MNNTTVVNVKVKHIRPKYNNLKEWCNDPNNVYIGRRGIVFIDGQRWPKHDSVWANPFKDKNESREQIINRYKKYILNRLNTEPHLIDQLKLLKGKNLGCWCKPEKCHGDVLIELLFQFNFI